MLYNGIMPGSILIGTSGFSYPHWRGVLYPESLPQSRWLERYSEVFGTVEINYSFYRLPKESTVAGWLDRTPEHFVFALKASRVITHTRKLAETGEATRRFFTAVLPLGDKLGPVLFQLPPAESADPPRLGKFLAALPKDRRYAFEFRHASWFTEDIYSILKEHDAALVWHDYGHVEWPRALTSSWIYLRLHGPSGRYAGEYGEQGLHPWTMVLNPRENRDIDAYIYFNNDFEGCAVRDAVTLKEMVLGTA